MIGPEQLEFQKLAREFALREISSRAPAADRDAHLPDGLLAKIKEIGLINVGLPEAYGGLGISTLDACVINEELAAACSGIASITEVSELALTPLLLDQKTGNTDTLLKLIGQDVSVLGLSVDFEGDVQDGHLIASQRSDGYLLQGSCRSVWNGTIGDWILVVAPVQDAVSQATPQVQTRTLVGLYLKNSVEGVETHGHANLLGRRAADVAELNFKNVFVEKRHAISFGDQPSDFIDAMASRNNPIVAAGCVGVARSALGHALRYSLERQTFNEPIAHHQAVALMLADMKKDIEAARAMTWRAALAADAGLSLGTTKSLPASCRVYAQEMVMSVTTDAVQVFGGYGYSKEYPVEKLMRDAKAYDLFGKTALNLKGNLGRMFLAAEVGLK
jgi:acyl-CoA dehydrogenase